MVFEFGLIGYAICFIDYDLFIIFVSYFRDTFLFMPIKLETWIN